MRRPRARVQAKPSRPASTSSAAVPRLWRRCVSAALALTVLVLAGCAGGRGETRAPDVPLIDQHGQRLSLTDLRGQVVVLTFFFTHCELTCPLYLATLASALGDVSEGVAVAAVTVDPERDTPDEVASYAAHWPAQWHFLTGGPSRVARIWRAYDILVERDESVAVQSRYGIIHSARVFVLDREGVTAATLRDGWTPAALRSAVDDARVGRQAERRASVPDFLGRLFARCGEFASAQPWTFSALVLVVMLPGFVIPVYVLRVLLHVRRPDAR